ncbi:MAG: MaoC/PaaZ C-terminal domain-containing protein, partial [Chloroflexota bacterium]
QNHTEGADRETNTSCKRGVRGDKMALFFEDIDIGSEIPTLLKITSTQQLVRWAGAVDNYDEIHFDKDVALARKLPGVIIQGALKNAFLGQLMTDWIGVEGTLKKLSCQHRGMDLPGDTLTCKGKVTNKYVKDSEHLVECEIWVENSKGERTAPGAATVALPSRGR